MSKNLYNLKQKLTCYVKDMPLLEDVSLKEHTSFKIGGNCPLLIEPQTQEELIKSISLIKKCRQKYYIIGAGTNLLAPDKGTKRVIIKLSKKFSGAVVEGEEITAFAGISITNLNKLAIKNGLGGLEWSYGIPGTLGGAIFMNAGAYGGQISDLVKSVVVFDGKKTITLKKEQIKFSYRKSLFQKNANFVIISARLSFNKTPSEQIKEACSQNLKKRKDAHPLNMPSAGSVFKRNKKLIVSKAIDELGLKGYSVGGAQISTKHAGFIVNTGEASNKDVQKLVKIIKKKISKKYKTKLNLELRILKD